MRSKYLFLLSFWLLSLASTMAHAILPIQHWQTSNGARVYFVENRGIPMLDLSIDFAAGAGFDRAQKQGVASMTNRILQRGSEGLTEDEIAGKTADVGAGISGRFDRDRAGLGMRTLSSRAEREQALEVFTRMLQKPMFPADVIAREKTRLIGSLKESDIQPGTIAGLTFNRLMYGAHPYGLRASGDIESVGNISRDDLEAFYRQNYVAKGAVIAIMGDVSRDEANAIAERITAGLPQPQNSAAALPVVEAKADKVTRLIPHHASQSHILIGSIGIARGDPDYFPLFVGNYILGGGGFASRINDEVRQKRGLAYSAGSYFSPLAQKGQNPPFPSPRAAQTAPCGKTDSAHGATGKTPRPRARFGARHGTPAVQLRWPKVEEAHPAEARIAASKITAPWQESIQSLHSPTPQGTRHPRRLIECF